MQTLIPSTLRRERNKRKLTLDVVSTAAEMSIQHLSEIESGKRDPRLSSIERIAMAMGLSLVFVPDEMLSYVNRYVATNGRVYTKIGAHSRSESSAANSTQGDLL